MEKPIIIVVGAGPGISLNVAKKFASENYRVVLISRNADKLQKLSDTLTSENVENTYYSCDVSNNEELESTFQKIKTEVGIADTLLYNAAVIRKEVPTKQDYDSLVTDFKVNIAGAVLSSQLIIPDMKKKKKGTILLTGGGLALKPYFEYTSLAIGKAGIRSLAFCLAQELKGSGIKVGTVTIAGHVKEGTHFSPDKIAEEFWKIHTGKNKGVEYIYQ
ncbi:MAG: short-chain dehydrogenase [Thalassobius sp.]|nr:short-chain dehydrogenase [Thalassovita sp.]